MILVDTSVWIDHFRKTNKLLQNLLIREEICTHELIVCELACGNLSNRKEILSLISFLPHVLTMSSEEILNFIDLNKLYGTGLGLIDINLLASALISKTELWTNDKRLNLAASKFNCSFRP